MRKVLVAAIGTLLVLCVLLPAISALLRPLDLLDITAIVLSLFAAIAWLIVAGVLATAWKWRSALLAVAVALVWPLRRTGTECFPRVLSPVRSGGICDLERVL